jgi:hypothetical protein
MEPTATAPAPEQQPSQAAPSPRLVALATEQQQLLGQQAYVNALIRNLGGDLGTIGARLAQIEAELAALPKE